jgi:hypothetical protein
VLTGGARRPDILEHRALCRGEPGGSLIPARAVPWLWARGPGFSGRGPPGAGASGPGPPGPARPGAGREAKRALTSLDARPSTDLLEKRAPEGAGEKEAVTFGKLARRGYRKGPLGGENFTEEGADLPDELLPGNPGPEDVTRGRRTLCKPRGEAVELEVELLDGRRVEGVGPGRGPGEGRLGDAPRPGPREHTQGTRTIVEYVAAAGHQRDGLPGVEAPGLEVTAAAGRSESFEAAGGLRCPCVGTTRPGEP